MPEGPSIILLKEKVVDFTGKTILRVEGNSKIDKERLINQSILAFRSWGKHFLIELSNFSLRIHFLLFGSYRINERKESVPRLSLQFTDGEINFYACSVKFIDEKLDDIYDWSSDVMGDQWNSAKTSKKLLSIPDTFVCDALLDQNIFSGIGNIIKNEVLHRIYVHPLSTIGALPVSKKQALIDEARQYSFDFLVWKKEFTLKKHWLAHTKRICSRCNLPLSKKKLGKTQRRSFFCEQCQLKY